MATALWRTRPPEPAWIALGANLGDPPATLSRTLRWLAAMPGTTLEAVSPFMWTAPVGPAQPRFLNAVVRVSSALPPARLLAALHALEVAAGRRRTIRWGPRTLDLDLLMVGGRVVADAGLVLPHPRMLERAFVLAPFAAIDAAVVHPVSGLTIGQHLAALGASRPGHDLL